VAENIRKFNTISSSAGDVFRNFNFITTSTPQQESSDTIYISDSILLNIPQEDINLSDSLYLSDEIELNLTLQKQELSDNLYLSDNIFITTDKVQESSDSIYLSDNIELNIPQENLNLSEQIYLSDTIQLNLTQEELEKSDDIYLSDEIIAQEQTTVSYATKLKARNSELFIVCDSDPAKIVKVTISSGGIPSWVTFDFNNTGETAKNAKDLTINDTTNQIYVGCSEGQVMKLNINNLTDRTQIDTGDTDNVENIDSYDEWNYTYCGTNDSNGEIIVIDESQISKLDSDFRFNLQVTKTLESQIDTLYANKIISDFRFNVTEENILNTDLRFIKYTFDEIALNPIARTDFHVYIDGTEVTDLDLESISINHTIDTESTATFILGRYHDKPDYTVDGNYNQITNQNTIVIKIKSITVFSGNINSLNFMGSSERIQVSAKGDEYTKNFNTIDLPLTLKTAKRNLYDVIVDDIVIDNPVIDPNDENPEIYKGIKIDLGTKTIENVIRHNHFGFNEVSTELSLGEFVPKQNWTYFWFVRAYHFFENYYTPTSFIPYGGSGIYVGTSLSSLSADVWDIYYARYFRQRELSDIEIDLGYYTLGSAPYREISSKNGQHFPKSRWVDEESGLYKERNEGYDYVDYAKEVASVEYEKLKNINGDILPVTSANVKLMIDGYLYYGIELLTRLNITNTTQDNIYKNNSGFPVAVKQVNISSSQMQVTLTCDNKLSSYEMDLLDEDYPDEDDPTYIIPSYRRKIAIKYDPANDEYVV